MLEIILLSNYQYILYQDDLENNCLNLTRDSGLGVYNFCFQIELTDKTDTNIMTSQVEKLRKEYLDDPKSFSSKYSELKLDSEQKKVALNNWMTKK